MKYNPSVYFILNKIWRMDSEDNQIRESKKLYMEDLINLDEYEMLCKEIIRPLQ